MTAWLTVLSFITIAPPIQEMKVKKIHSQRDTLMVMFLAPISSGSIINTKTLNLSIGLILVPTTVKKKQQTRTKT